MGALQGRQARGHSRSDLRAEEEMTGGVRPEESLADNGTASAVHSSATSAPPQSESAAPLVGHFFRHEAARLVSVLTRVFGWRHFDLVEDMVQATLLDALQAWRVGVPENPSGWLHRVAKNKILDALRRNQIGRRVVEELAATQTPHEGELDGLFLDSEIEDSQLKMMFACCHPRLARENQLALTLKALCGFGNSEIARALLVEEETVKKRLQRATRDLIDRQIA